MIWMRYLLTLALGLTFFVVESCKPDAKVYMPTVTNTHVTETENKITPITERTQVIGEVTSSSSNSISSRYPLHRNILTTVFWVGEEKSDDNGQIDNLESAWVSDWKGSFGGYDDPTARNGYWPAGFTPKENPFYFALPYGDYTEAGLKSNITLVYWYEKPGENKSLLKNRWIKIMFGGKVAYGQWEDVGPFEDDDVGYVFGTAQPKQSVGLDVSPAIRDYLGLSGRDRVSWQFVDSDQVPQGPWKEIITRSDPQW